MQHVIVLLKGSLSLTLGLNAFFLVAIVQATCVMLQNIKNLANMTVSW